MGPGFCSELVLLRRPAGDDQPGRLHRAGRPGRRSSGSPSSSSPSATRPGAWSAAGGRRAAATTRSWWCCTPGCWSACSSRRGCAGPDVPAALAWSMLALVLASQALRWWCIATLGRRWNTRVIVVPGLPLVRSGPYRLLSPPQLRRRRRRGDRAAAGARRLDHRAGLHGASTRSCSPCGIRVENAALATAHERSPPDAGPGGRGRRPGRPGDGAVRRPRRPRRRGPRAARRA